MTAAKWQARRGLHQVHGAGRSVSFGQNQTQYSPSRDLAGKNRGDTWPKKPAKLLRLASELRL